MTRLAFSVTLVLVLAAFVPACGTPAPPAPSYHPIATTKELMDAMDPIADEFWDVVGTVVTKDGTFEKAPSTDEEWAAVRNHAVILSETGSMLLYPSRAGGSAEWIKQANALIDTTQRSIKAIDAKDKTALFNVGAEVYEACTNCHRQFMPAIVNAK
ncbi:MAG: hypothetical protein ABI665_08195 [Vicinamibacterales bacterium]